MGVGVGRGVGVTGAGVRVAGARVGVGGRGDSRVALSGVFVGVNVGSAARTTIKSPAWMNEFSFSPLSW